MKDKKTRRLPFGGMKINFKSVKSTTFGDVFETEPLSVGAMMKQLWKFIKANKLNTSPKKSKDVDEEDEE